MSINNFTDAGIAYIARFLPNATLKTLTIGNIGVTDMGIVPVLETLSRQQTLEQLSLCWSASRPDKSLAKIGDYIKESKLEKIELVLFCPPMPSEEAEEDWIQNIVVGGNSLICHIQYSKVSDMNITTFWDDKKKSFPPSRHLQLKISSLQETVKSINLERKKKNLNPLKLDVS